jgi:hypothetical protein
LSRCRNISALTRSIKYDEWFNQFGDTDTLRAKAKRAVGDTNGAAADEREAENKAQPQIARSGYRSIESSRVHDRSFVARQKPGMMLLLNWITERFSNAGLPSAETAPLVNT